MGSPHERFNRRSSGVLVERVKGERFMSGKNESVPPLDDWSVRVKIMSCHPQALQCPQYSTCL